MNDTTVRVILSDLRGFVFGWWPETLGAEERGTRSPMLPIFLLRDRNFFLCLERYGGSVIFRNLCFMVAVLAKYMDMARYFPTLCRIKISAKFKIVSEKKKKPCRFSFACDLVQ